MPQTASRSGIGGRRSVRRNRISRRILVGFERRLAWIGLILIFLGVASPVGASGDSSFFRVGVKGGLSCFIDPDGNPFFSTGVCLVNSSGDFCPALGYSPYQRSIAGNGSSKEQWASRTSSRLAEWNFNTLGAWSETDAFANRMPYTLNLDLSPGNWQDGDVPDFWSEEFYSHVRRAVSRQVTPRINDRQLIGYFFGNEMRWGPDWRGTNDLFAMYLSLPADAPGKAALVDWLRRHYNGNVKTFADAWNMAIGDFEQLRWTRDISACPVTSGAQSDRRKFAGYAAEHFFKTCHDFIREVDPYHLLLGARFVSWTTPREVAVAIKDYTDVVSINHYELQSASKDLIRALGKVLGWMNPDDMLLRYYRDTGKPILISEFSFRAVDSGLPNTRPPRWLFPTSGTQTQRASNFAHYARAAIEREYIIGYHWFAYMDEPGEGRFDGENANCGLVNIRDQPWSILTSRMKKVNAEAIRQRGTCGSPVAVTNDEPTNAFLPPDGSPKSGKDSRKPR